MPRKRSEWPTGESGPNRFKLDWTLNSWSEGRLPCISLKSSNLAPKISAEHEHMADPGLIGNWCTLHW